MIFNISAFRFIALLCVSILGYLPLQAQELDGGKIGYHQPPSESTIMSYGSGRIRIYNRAYASGGKCLSYEYQWQVSYDQIEWFNLPGYVYTEYNENYAAEIPLQLEPGETSGSLYFRRRSTCEKTGIAYSNILRINMKLPGTEIQSTYLDVDYYLTSFQPQRASLVEHNSTYKGPFVTLIKNTF